MYSTFGELMHQGFVFCLQNLESLPNHFVEDDEVWRRVARLNIPPVFATEVFAIVEPVVVVEKHQRTQIPVRRSWPN